jgi:hypothetical protein
MGSCQKSYAIAGLLIIALSLTGCPSNPVQPANEYKLALEQADPAWFDECQGLGDITDRKVGTLLQDFTDLSGLAAPCRADHNALVRYLKPFMEKAKAGESP